jgi:hypothetical protein
MDHSSTSMSGRCGKSICRLRGLGGAHVGALMDAYNLLNGTYMTANGYFARRSRERNGALTEL